MEQISSDWVLFLDADVRLQPDALRRALRQAIDDGSGLFSLAPRLEVIAWPSGWFSRSWPACSASGS